MKRRKKKNKATKEKERILQSIERGVKDVAAYMRGEIELRDARSLLDEL